MEQQIVEQCASCTSEGKGKIHVVVDVVDVPVGQHATRGPLAMQQVELRCPDCNTAALYTLPGNFLRYREPLAL